MFSFFKLTLSCAPLDVLWLYYFFVEKVVDMTFKVGLRGIYYHLRDYLFKFE